VLQIIDKIVNILAPSFKFGYYDVDDLKQEGRLEAIKALDRFDPLYKSKYDVASKLEAFLLTHIRNRYINLKRDKFSRCQLPCECCSLYGVRKKKCKKYINIEDCDKYTKWIKRNSSKKSLMYTVEDNNDQVAHTSTDNSLIKKEIVAIIDKKLPLHLRKLYKMYIEGSKLSKAQINKIVTELKDILKEYAYERE